MVALHSKCGWNNRKIEVCLESACVFVRACVRACGRVRMPMCACVFVACVCDCVFSDCNGRHVCVCVLGL